MTDFGLSKKLKEGEEIVYSFCGSPVYLSPEMLEKKGVGREIDIYGLGLVMYELLVGIPPFFSKQIKDIYNKIQTCRVEIPAFVSKEAKRLIKVYCMIVRS